MENPGWLRHVFLTQTSKTSPPKEFIPKAVGPFGTCRFPSHHPTFLHLLYDALLTAPRETKAAHDSQIKFIVTEKPRRQDPGAVGHILFTKRRLRTMSECFPALMSLFRCVQPWE